jgi:hypothetical protein
MGGRGWIAAVAGVLVTVAAAAPAHGGAPGPEYDPAGRAGEPRLESRGGDWQPVGLLRGRDLTPFGFLRLDMRPASAVAARPGQWVVSADLGYQNTWAVGGAARPYLEGLSGRRELSPTDWAAIRAGGEAYIVDLELGLADLSVSYGFSERLSAYLVASAVSYRGGWADGTIESFHRRFGFSDFERDVVARDDVNVLVNLRSVQSELYEAPTSGGLLDPTIGLRYQFERTPRPWNLIVEAAVKPAPGGRRAFLSTGATDFGLQVTGERVQGRAAIYLSGAIVRTGGRQPVESSRRWIPTAIVGYERALGARSSVVLQGYASLSAYGREDTSLAELRRNKYQAAIGLRHRRGPIVWSFAFTENLQNLDNTPDVGLQFGMTYLPES